MAQLLKIETNARETINSLRHLEKDWIGALRKVSLDVMELARQRVVSQMIRGGGRMIGKRLVYNPVPGANIPKFVMKRIKNTQPGAVARLFGEKSQRQYARVLSDKMYFNSSKLVERSGETLDVFQRMAPGLIMDVKREGNLTVGYFGVEGGGGYSKHTGKSVGSVEARIASHETGISSRGFKKKPRRPLSKALQYGAARFETLMAMHLRNVEKTFNAKAA